MELIIGILFCFLVAVVIMVITNIIYDVAAILIPTIAVIVMLVGIIVGGAVAVKNTFTSYRDVYFRKGR